jgi:hypothetical protein
MVRELPIHSHNFLGGIDNPLEQLAKGILGNLCRKTHKALPTCPPPCLLSLAPWHAHSILPQFFPRIILTFLIISFNPLCYALQLEIGTPKGPLWKQAAPSAYTLTSVSSISCMSKNIHMLPTTPNMDLRKINYSILLLYYIYSIIQSNMEGILRIHLLT